MKKTLIIISVLLMFITLTTPLFCLETLADETTTVPYLTFQSENPFTIRVASPKWNGTMEYSTNTISWFTWDGSVISSLGGKIYLRGTGNTRVSSNSSGTYSQFIISGTAVECVGNIETLLDWQTVINGEHPEMNSHCFKGAFRDCSALIKAPELPANNLTNNCYEIMFANCTSLTTAPALPSKYLYNACYYGMFSGCTSLIIAPALPADHLSDECCAYMFYGCTSIKISTTKSGIYQYEWRIPTSGTITFIGSDWNKNMFYNTGGTFKGNPNTNTTYYVEHEPIQMVEGYNIYFNSMGGSSIPTIENTTLINLVDVNGNYLYEYIPTRTGYKFDGWYNSTEYTTKITVIFIIDSDKTLYAKWTPIYIYFHMNGGSGVGYYGETDIGEYQYDGGTLDLIDSEGNYKLQFTPFKAGWIFGGWYTDQELTIPILYVNTEDDIHLYAKWTRELLVELNLNSNPDFRINIVNIDKDSGTYITGSETIVRYIVGNPVSPFEESSYIDFYAVSAGAAEIRFNDYDGNEYTFVIYVLEYGTTINYFKTIYIGSRYEITEGLTNVDLSSMTYIGGDNTYCYVSSPYAGIPLNGDETPEGDYIYFYGLKKGYCIINFNGKNDYPPVTFYLTILGVGEIDLTQSVQETNKVYIPPAETWRGWENLQKQLEDGYHNNFINLDEFAIPGELNGFISNFNVWVNPLYTNGFVVLALTLVGIIAFASYLVTAKIRG